MDEKEKTVELDYKRADNKKLFTSNLFDAFAMIILAVLLSLSIFAIYFNTPMSRDLSNRRDEIILSSHLYEKKDGIVKDLYSIIDEDKESSVDEKSKIIDDSLTFFFQTFVKDKNIYDDYKRRALNKEEHIFDDNLQRKYLNDDYDIVYFNFYNNMLKDIAPGYLSSSKEYRDNLRQSIINNVLIIFISLIISNIIFYYVVPMIYRRGKQTFGMKIFKISLLSVDGMSCSSKRYSLRFLFYLIVIVVLSVFSFLLPVLISFTMMLLSKTGQSLVDYVTNTYKVDSQTNTVYLNYEEYMYNQHSRDDKKIENLDVVYDKKDK